MNALVRALRSPALRHVPHVVCVGAVVEVGLRVTTLPRLARLLGVRLALAGSAPDDDAPPDLGPADAARHHAVHRVMQVWPWGRNGQCLRESLTAARLLRHRDAQVRLGAARTARGTVAHAWVVVDGRTLDPTAARYVPLGAVRG